MKYTIDQDNPMVQGNNFFICKETPSSKPESHRGYLASIPGGRNEIYYRLTIQWFKALFRTLVQMGDVQVYYMAKTERGCVETESLIFVPLWLTGKISNVGMTMPESIRLRGVFTQ